MPNRTALAAALTAAAIGFTAIGLGTAAAADTSGWAGLVHTNGDTAQLIPSDPCRGLDLAGLGDAIHRVGFDNSYC